MQRCYNLQSQEITISTTIELLFWNLMCLFWRYMKRLQVLKKLPNEVPLKCFDHFLTKCRWTDYLQVFPATKCLICSYQNFSFLSSKSCPFLFCAILKIWKAKSSSQMGAFFYPIFANWVRVNEPTSVVHVFECQFFFIKLWQICRRMRLK